MDGHQKEVFDTLLSMGFPENDIDRAWKGSDIKTIEGLINWLDSNPANAGDDLSKQQGDQSNRQDAKAFVQNISGLVKPEIVSELKVQGFSQLVAEKAALLSGNRDTNSALAWIMEHQTDPDFEDPIQAETKPKLTPEEARLKAKELQAQMRQKTLEQDAKNELEAEKLRLKMGKEIVEARRIMEEQKAAQELEAYMREKNKTEAEKLEMQRILEADKRQKFGGKAAEKPAKTITVKDEYYDIYDRMYKVYRLGETATLKTCVATISTIVSNVLKDPKEEKFRKINASNPNFVARVKDVVGGVKLLNFIGFVEENGFFVFASNDINRLQEISTFLQSSLHNLG